MRSYLKVVPLAAMVAAAGACDEDGGTGPLPPAAMVAVAPLAQGGTAGAAVAAAPAVRVTDAEGRPVAGVEVTFTVTAGSGLMGSGSRTTDPGGIATAGSWTLGPRVGPNEVTATAPGLTPVVFSASAAPGATATLARAGGDGQTGVVGSVLADSLDVRVADANGNPVSGVVVSFAITAGGGALSPSAAATGANGVARTRMTLGRQAGTATASASAGALPQVAFTAQAVAGAPTLMAAHAGDDQEAPAGGAVAVHPAVRVTDAFGNALAGVAVRFAVAGGGGRTTGANGVTGADGVAAVGSWTLGAAGVNTLTASSAGVAGVTFTAVALDPCVLSAAYTFGSTHTGELDAADCRLGNGNRIEFLDLALDSVRNFAVDMRADRDAFLYLFNSAGTAVAANDDGGGGTSARLHVIAPAGRYFVGASASGGLGGAAPQGYTVTTGPGGEVTGCTQPWIIPGISTSQQLTSADSCYYFFGLAADRYLVQLRAGQTVTIRHLSTAYDAFLTLYGPNGSVVASNDDGDGGLNSRITFTATTAGRYTIEARPLSFGTGAYTLIVQ